MLLCLASRKNVHHFQLFHSTFYELKEKKRSHTEKHRGKKQKRQMREKRQMNQKICARLIKQSGQRNRTNVPMTTKMGLLLWVKWLKF